MKWTNVLAYSIGGLILLFCIAVFRPVPIVSEDKCEVQSGTVSHVFEGGVLDLCIRIHENNKMYYINRGLENGLDLKEMQEKLTGEYVTIKYPSYWTPLNWDNSVRHISKLEINGEVLFDETLK